MSDTHNGIIPRPAIATISVTTEKRSYHTASVSVR